MSSVDASLSHTRRPLTGGPSEDPLVSEPSASPRNGTPPSHIFRCVQGRSADGSHTVKHSRLYLLSVLRTPVHVPRTLAFSTIPNYSRL